MKKFVLGAIALFVMTFVGCKKDDVEQDLKLLVDYEINFSSLTKTQTIKIEGSGDYTFSWDDDSVASVELWNKTQLIIKPEKGGKGLLTITDNVTKQTSSIRVSIPKNLKVSQTEVILSSTTTQKVEIDIEGNGDYAYNFSNYSVADINFSEDKTKVIITPRLAGETFLTIIDEKTKQKETIHIMVDIVYNPTDYKLSTDRKTLLF